MDFERITQKMLQEVRGGHSTQQESELLGFSYDKYYRWENDYQKLDLVDFITIFETKHVDLVHVLNDSLSIKCDDLKQGLILQSILEEWGSPSYKLMSERIGFSKSKWWRIKSGESKMSLVDFFKFVDIMTGRLPILLKQLMPYARGKELSHSTSEYEKSLKVLSDNPEIAFLTSLFYLKSYRSLSWPKKTAFLANKMSVSVSHVERLINILNEHDILTKKEYGYEVKTFKTHITNKEQLVSQSLSSFLIRLNLAHLNSLDKDFLSKNFKIAPISNTAAQEISVILKNSFKEISKIIDNDDPDSREKIIAFYQSSILY